MPKKPNPLRMMAPLDDDEFEELEDFLMSDAVSSETMMFDCLDGYLTAIVIGPTSIPMSQWLHKVWGPKPSDAPAFATMDDAQHIIDLILRHMNGIVWALQDNPYTFDPVLDEVEYPNDPRSYLNGEMWAHGFMEGVELCRADWQPLFDDAESRVALDPLRILGADEITAEEEKLTETPAQREELTKKITESVAAIYHYWMPYRKAVQERLVATTITRDQPKIGRNDPCPCGSGKKFKKCCGAATILH